MLKDKPNVFVDEVVDRKTFIRQYVRTSGQQYTLDQGESVATHLNSVWLNAMGNSTLKWASRPSVFNVLLHFTTEALTIKDNMPVCHYEHLLRWHNLSSFISEDTLTCSFLAARDLQNHTHRNSFKWPTVIAHDNKALNEIFQKRMADLHFHLNGSSLNFDLNWLSLMNKVSGRKKSFDKLHFSQHEVQTLIDGQTRETFYTGVIKASALRILLFEFLLGGSKVAGIPSSHLSNLEAVLNSLSDKEVSRHTGHIDTITQALRHLYGKKYVGKDGSLRIPDYVTSDSITTSYKKTDKDYVFSVLSGERWLMYELYREIYVKAKSVDKRVVAWFYAYLLYKAQFRTEIVQKNNTMGFANFANYEGRKSCFIGDNSVYATLLGQMAVVSFLGKENKEYYLEARITPKTSTRQLDKHIRRADHDALDSHFIDENVAASFCKNLSYTLHFIKKQDNGSIKKSVKGKCRHYDLRYKVKREAMAIWNLRKGVGYSSRNRVVGIDAANSEIYTRPEVFAQAFRYLRDDWFDMSDYDHPRDLGMTYHVGEDFQDIVDGLRAIDEVIHFLGFRNGDRLGHALVLGMDVKDYYSSRHNTVLMPCMDILDNIVWLYNVGKGLSGFDKACRDLEIMYEVYFRKVYGHLRINATMWDYYQSWLLRGDNPQMYYLPNRKGKHVVTSRWSMYNANNDSAAIEASKNDNAVKLYGDYHFDPDVRKSGACTEQIKLSDDIVFLIAEVQKKMLTDIEKANICIECNPTSNLNIGKFKGYSKHPIVSLFNYMLHTDKEPHSISVSINTDDKGIFATSLEREYSLLALSLEKEYAKDHKNPPRLIYDWLDKIRELGFEQKF